jgi:hypothetical protein
LWSTAERRCIEGAGHGDDRQNAILCNCRAAMADTGKRLLVERLRGAPNEPDRGKLMDLMMLVGPGGLERTEDHDRRLFAAAGFQLARVVPTPGPASIIDDIRH